MVLTLRTTLWRFRWFVVAACLALTAWLVITELRPPPATTTAVTVASQALAAGHILTADDVRTTYLPTAPEHMLSLEAAVGASLTVAVPEGFPLIETMVLGPGLSDAAPGDWVVAGVVLADPVAAQLFRVGDRVDLYMPPTSPGGRAELVTSQALILALPAAVAPGQMWGTTTGSEQTVLVVAVAPGAISKVLGATSLGPMQAVLSS
ncbi:MAG: SAF domain-containing protein [Beutenbergiaceae bacterium]